MYCSWLEGYGSPPRGHNGTIDSHGRLTFSVGNPKQLVKEQLPDLLRLSTDCPFEDVRERCSGILLDLQVCVSFAVLLNLQLLNSDIEYKLFFENSDVWTIQIALYVAVVVVS